MTTNTQARGLRVASVIFGLVSLLHLLRVFTGPEVVIGAYHVGPTASLLVTIVTGGLAIWLSRLAGSSPPKAAGPGDP